MLVCARGLVEGSGAKPIAQAAGDAEVLLCLARAQKSRLKPWRRQRGACRDGFTEGRSVAAP